LYLADPAVFATAVGQRVEALTSLLDDYERDLPPGTCERFLRGLKSISDALVVFHEESLSHARSSYGDDPATQNEQIVFYSNLVLRVLRNIHEEYLPFLDSGTHQNEYSVLPSILRVVRLFENDVEVTLIPKFEYCYGFVGFQQFVSRVLDILEKHAPAPLSGKWTQVRAKAASPKITAFLLYPVAERDSALRLAVLAHELAHLVDQIQLLYRECLPLKLEPDSFNKLVNQYHGTPIGPSKDSSSGDKPLTLGQIYPKETLEAQLFKDCNSMVESWLRELIADVLAVHVLGPAYYFAFVEFLTHAAAEDKFDSEHDQPGFRLKLIFQELEYLRYFEVQNPLSKVLRQSRDRVEKEMTEDYDSKALVVHKTIGQNLAKIQGKLREFIDRSGFAFSASKYNDEVPHIVSRLMQGVSPAEWYHEATNSLRPSSMVGVLNAGWQVYETSFDEFCALFSESMPITKRLVNLNELLFHAIESSEVVRLWNRMATHQE
jgi:hypothetical protein